MAVWYVYHFEISSLGTRDAVQNEIRIAVLGRRIEIEIQIQILKTAQNEI